MRFRATVPVIANITPSGKYLMEDFFYAGGLRALMGQMRDLLDLSCITVSGRTVGDNIAGAKVHLPDVIHSLQEPLYPEGATAVLTGNLAPRGCVMKPAAADKRLLHHRGKALAFENYDAMAAAVDRDDLDVTPDHVLVLEKRRPERRPRHAGMGPIADSEEAAQSRRARHAAHFRRAHERHQLRRLHSARRAREFCRRSAGLRARPATRSRSTSPRGRIHLHVGDEELTRRRAAWQPPAPRYPRGYGAMYSQHIGQADEGCDFDFLQGQAPIAEPEIH